MLLLKKILILGPGQDFAHWHPLAPVSYRASLITNATTTASMPIRNEILAMIVSRGSSVGDHSSGSSVKYCYLDHMPRRKARKQTKKSLTDNNRILLMQEHQHR